MARNDLKLGGITPWLFSQCVGPVPTAGSIGKVALDPLAGRLSVTAAAGTWTFGVGKYRDPYPSPELIGSHGVRVEYPICLAQISS